jgi:hypothetical protein
MAITETSRFLMGRDGHSTPTLSHEELSLGWCVKLSSAATSSFNIPTSPAWIQLTSTGSLLVSFGAVGAVATGTPAATNGGEFVFNGEKIINIQSSQQAFDTIYFNNISSSDVYLYLKYYNI